MKKSFTLIELLVVLAIIGILAAMIIASLSGARARARDATRKSDLRQVKTALEMYFNDIEKYPTGVGVGTDWTTLTATLSASPTVYMSTVPKDPQDPDKTYSYVPVDLPTPGTAYYMCATLERGITGEGIWRVAPDETKGVAACVAP